MPFLLSKIAAAIRIKKECPKGWHGSLCASSYGIAETSLARYLVSNDIVYFHKVLVQSDVLPLVVEEFLITPTPIREMIDGVSFIYAFAIGKN